MTSPRALIARRGRTGAGVLALCALAVVAGLGVAVHDRSTATGFDRAVDDWSIAHAGGRVAQWLADLGDRAVVIVLVAALVGACAAWRTVRGVVLAVAAPLAASCLTEYVIKPWVHCTKGGYYAYPSGHTVGSWTVALALVVIVSGPARRALSRRARRVVVAVALLLAVACAFGLVASDYHYATDVVGGACLSVATVLLAALVVDVVDVVDVVADRLATPIRRSISRMR